MPLVIPNVYMCSIKGLSGGQDIVNVVGIKADFSSASQVAAAVKNAWIVANGPMSKLPNLYTFVEVKAMELTTITGEISVVAGGGTGGLVGPLATNAACALITYGSGTRSKSQRGRMYFGPIREVDINSDGRTLVSTTAWSTPMTVFRDSIAGAGMEWGVISRKLSSFSGISVIAAQPVIATQRRRIR